MVKERQFISQKNSDSSKKFVIYWRADQQKDDEMLDEVSSLTEEAYLQGGKYFGWYPEDVVQVILYYGEEYGDFTVFPLWSQGGYDGKLRIMVRKGMPRKILKELIFHEYAHLVIQGLTKGNCPLWFNEPTAQYFSRVKGLREKIAFDLPSTRYDEFPKNWTNLREDEVKSLYKDSLMTLLRIIGKSDDIVIVNTLRALGDGLSFENALNQALSIYGFTIKDVLRQGE